MEKSPKNGSRALSEQRASMKVYISIYILYTGIYEVSHAACKDEILELTSDAFTFYNIFSGSRYSWGRFVVWCLEI